MSGNGPRSSFWSLWPRCKGCPQTSLKPLRSTALPAGRAFASWLILLLRLVEAFKVFDIPTSLTLGGPGRATEVYSLFTYRTALRFFDHGYASAQGFLLLLIVSLIVALIFRQLRTVYQEEGN